MKMKYYLRGLGTGILFATIVLFIAYSYRMSDSQIKERAKELGMVFVTEEESKSSILADNNETKDTNDGTTTGSSQVESTSETTGEKPDETESVDEESTTTGKSDETSTSDEQQSTSESETESLSESTTEATSESNTENTSTEENTSSSYDDSVKCQLTVTNATVSGDVARALEAAGVIDNGEEFNKYLSDNGYSRRIQNGTYTIVKGMSYKEIAEIITYKEN